MPIERKIKMAETKEPNYLTNICGRCGEPQLGVHYHESEEEDELAAFTERVAVGLVFAIMGVILALVS
jgi:hypothetical protein